MTAADVPAHQPAAVHDGRRTTAVSAPARAHGVRRGMRRRHAQECCPDLVMLSADDGRDVRLFEPVAAAAETAYEVLCRRHRMRRMTTTVARAVAVTLDTLPLGLPDERT
jgi:nucleotidyltransferase/DNA polymerase involved in DNA repair